MTMSSEPPDVDTSALDELAKISAEQDGLRELTDKARAFRDRAVEVCERVVRDYCDRIAALEAQAQALRQKARRDLATLVTRHEQARLAVERARSGQQEVDFRYEIGELRKADYPERRKAADEEVARREADFGAADALKRRFTDALKDVAPPPLHAHAVDAPPAGTRGEGFPHHVEVPHPAGHEPVVTPAQVPALSSSSPPPTLADTFLPASSVEAGSSIRSPEPDEPIELVPPLTPVPTGLPAALAAGEIGTIAIAPAVLCEERAGNEGPTHRLSFVTTIGRTPDNHIAVPEAEVSRHHARITLTDRGFVLEDLRSGNGTLVNGERLSGEQLLKDEDRVRIGSRTFVFRVQ